jgi:SAM-dependent methyltransferase
VRTLSDSIVWHDLECGRYEADLPYWTSLAGAANGPILDVGAGTGRVALHLARAGHEVTALDRDEELLAELARRAALQDAAVSTVVADAREFRISETFGLILAPMQTIQLLRSEGRTRFLHRALEHLRPEGRLAAAITEQFDLYDGADGDAGRLPEPDVQELGGTVYVSQPTAVRQSGAAVVLERLRETLGPDGGRLVELHTERLDALSSAQLEREADKAGLRPSARDEIASTSDHVGSVVVVLNA